MTTAMEVLADTQVRKADELRRQIEAELSGALGREEELSRSYVRIGVLLYKFRQEEFWRVLDYSGFEHFISEMSEKFDRGRTQLFEYVSIVEKLLPQIDAKILEEMGSTKARVLRQAQRAAGGRALPEEVLVAAGQQTVTANQLRALAHECYNIGEHITEKGTWADFSFYVSHDEREVLKRAYRAAERTDPVIAKDLPDWVRRKEVVLRWALDYLSGNEAAANRGEA